MTLLFQLIFFLGQILLPVCAEEDSTNCSWNAQVQGDGNGTSFVNIGGLFIYADGSTM